MHALVLNVLAENLDALKCGGWGVFIAPTTKVAIGEGCCRRVHRTVTVHCLVRLLAPALTSACAVRTVHCYCTLLQTTVDAIAVTLHGTPDSPVLHRTVR
jgi:hypothetical protein